MDENVDESNGGEKESNVTQAKEQATRQRKNASALNPGVDAMFGNSSTNDFRNNDEMNNNVKREQFTNSRNENAFSMQLSREEYTKSLNQWIHQCYHWHYFRTMSYFMICASNSALYNNQRTTSSTVTVTSQAQQQMQLGRVYKIPALWKRALAELIDFVFLLLIKVIVTYLVLDYLQFIDQNKYDFSLIDDEFDAYHLAYEWSSEIIIIEVMHRLIVVIFETLFLCLRQHRQRPGGATPGKMFLGLKVISCTQVIDIGNDVVQVLPAEDIGFWRSLLRAVIKNVSSVFFLPTSLTVFVSNHKRAAYDFASKSIVVEEITGNAQPRRN